MEYYMTNKPQPGIHHARDGLLRPCPCCGSTDIFVHYGDIEEYEAKRTKTDPKGPYMISCCACGLHTTWNFNSMERWNKRAGQ
jgi:hypothetical protein